MHDTRPDTHVNLPKATMWPPAGADGEPGTRLRGRRSESGVLDRLVMGVRAGQSQVLVLRGEPGVGKTALLEYLLERASGCRIAQAAGVESAATAGQPPPEVSLPVAFTVFPAEIFQAPRSWAEKVYPNLIYFHEAASGGHFAAWEEPGLFSEEIRTAFRSLR